MELNNQQEKPLEQPQKEVSTSSKKPKFLFIILGIVVLCILSTGYLLATKSKQTISQVVPAVKNSPPSVSDSVSNWKTYINNPRDMAFSIKYPSNLTIEEQAGGFFAFLKNPKNHDDFDFYIDERQMKILPIPKFTEKIYQSKNWTVRIGCQIDFCKSETFSQILSTFKFTDQSQTGEPSGSADTSSWKTYTSDKFHYSIKYPSNFSTQEAGPGVTIYIGKESKNIDNPFTISEEWDPEGCRAECPSISRAETLNISGIPMRKLEGQVGYPNGWHSTFTKYVIKAKNYSSENAFTYVITSYYDVPGKISNQREVLDQIVETFKFIQ